MLDVPDEFYWGGLFKGECADASNQSDSLTSIPLFESPIFNASPLVRKEFKSTAIEFGVKIGCDVHQVSEEDLRYAVNAHMYEQARARLEAALREEISRSSDLEDVFGQIVDTRVIIDINPFPGIHNGQLRFELCGVVLSVRTALSIIGTLWEGLIDNPIMTPMLGSVEVFPLLLNGGSFRFF